MNKSFHALDEPALNQYLEAQSIGVSQIHSIKKFADGQSNPTYLLSAKSGQYVLRRKPPGILLKSAHAIDREYRVIRALQCTDVPVPRALHLCEDPTIIGSEFFIMSFIDGKTFWKPELPELTIDARTACYDNINKTLVAIHSVDIESVGLSDFGKPGNYFERQYTRWTEQYRATETECIPEMDAAIEWLSTNLIDDDGRVSLTHGDFRIDNLMCSHDGTQVLAVLDWELSTLGHPFADLAYQCALWRMPPEAALSGLKGIKREELGIPGEEQYVDLYCERMGIAAIEHWNFYRVFSLFRMAAIVQGVKKRHLEGNASSENAMGVGALVKPLAAEAAKLL
ncbi:MAG: phosphotransferase family protein [Gammaproteobacteria bacterium]|nr:phosphotransferase family protein [Gammaproteobacteria bacterium]